MFKRSISLILVLLVICNFSGCTKDTPYALYNYPLSKWQSTDNIITIYVNGDGDGYCTIMLDDEKIDLFVDFYLDVALWFHDIDYYLETGVRKSIENWKTKCSDGKFVATVEDTTYFEFGQEFTFVLVEDNLSEEDIPYPIKPEEESKNKETITQYI